MKNDDNTIWINPELTVFELLERAKRAGELVVCNGDDRFIIRRYDEALPATARDFLMRGGPVEGS